MAKKTNPLNEWFLGIADWVSEYMGHPGNIIFWLVAVIVWTLLFALDKQLASGSFLPSWFTSQGYNFPLNLITTVAELFIGFLVAAATNRAQRALTKIINHILHMVDQQDRMEKETMQLMQENTILTQQIFDLAQTIHELVKDKETVAAGDTKPQHIVR